MSDTNAWIPLLTGAAAERALEAIEAVARDAREQPAGEPSLAGGAAGLAVLFAYLDYAWPDSGHDATACRFLQQAVEGVASSRMMPDLYGGFTGVAWTIQHLQGWFLERDSSDPNAAIDATLLQYVSRSPWQGDYDLISGLAGFGAYALEKSLQCGVRNAECGMGKTGEPALGTPHSAFRILEAVVDRLADVAERTPEGCTWFTAPELLPQWQREICPNGYYNLGLAHGVPGVIAVLGGACAAGVRPDVAPQLLEGAVKWLLGQRLPGNGTAFPSWAGPGIEEKGSRLAWCYGDAGVVAALLGAGRAVDNSDWERAAVEIALRAVARPAEEAGVQDAGLCHGAAGLGLIFNRMYQSTNEPRLAEAARFWFERTLKMRKPGEGIGGFLAWEPLEDLTPHWEAEAGLLTGGAGIALALLSAAMPIESEWDRALPISNAVPRDYSGSV